MQEAVPVGEGSMIAILGMTIDQINDYIKKIKINKACEIANDNSIGQVLLAGDKESIDSLQMLLKEKKLNFYPLNVSAPFHCSLMKPAADYMAEKINSN